jgi:HEAT repeat protein
MKKAQPLLLATLAIVLTLGLAGCSRTLDKVARWKAAGKVEKLIRALEDKQPEIREASAEALGELRAKAAVTPLAARFADTENRVVLASVNALVQIGNAEASTNLVDALKLELTEARVSAAAGLGEIKALHALDALIEALDDPEEAVNCAAATSLGSLGDEKASAPLADKLKSRSDKLRLACAQSLGNTGGKTAAKALTIAMGDKNAEVRKASVDSLIAIGKASAPYALIALRHDKQTVRAGAITVLRNTGSIPTAGSDLIWYELAVVSVDKKTAVNKKVVVKLAQMGKPAIETLLEAAAHNVADIREHAFLALELIGNSSTKAAMAAAGREAGRDAKDWFKNRSAWSGAPSWRIDLWGALTALNPDFEFNGAKASNMQAQGRNAFRVITAPDFEPRREYIPLLIALLGDQTVPPPEQPAVDEFGMPVIRKPVDRFRGEANQQMAKEKLIAAGTTAVLPLIAAIDADNALVAGHACSILAEIGDRRAAGPMISSMEKKLAAGEVLTDSALYAALQRLDVPKAEPVLLKVHPNTDRAIRVFERQYAGVRVNFAEILSTEIAPTERITFRVGYVDGKTGQIDLVFTKESSGDWVPALPDELP